VREGWERCGRLAKPGILYHPQETCRRQPAPGWNCPVLVPALPSRLCRPLNLLQFSHHHQQQWRLQDCIIISGVDTLKDKREVLTERFFKRHVLPSSSLLHYLLPDRRDNDTVNSLRHSQPLHTLWTRTTRFHNCFVPYCLNTYI